MRDQLKKYIDLLFAGAPNAGEIKDEILQNTLDRYDDMIAQGKTPEAAYQLAISGIGDVSELLGSNPTQTPPPVQPQQTTGKPIWKRILFAVAIFLYIVAAIPLIVLSSMNMAEFGLCGTLAIAAVATPLLIIASGGKKEAKPAEEDRTPEDKAADKAGNIIWPVGVILYLLISLLTSAWHITWIIFCILPCITGIWSAVLAVRNGKSNALVKLILLAILALILLSILIGGIAGNGISLGYSEFIGLPGGTEASSGEADSQIIRNIDIRWVGGKIILRRDSESQRTITFQEEGSHNGPQMAYRVDGDTLIIAYAKESTWSFGINQTIADKTLTVTVPYFWDSENITINSVSAEVDLKDMLGEELDLVTVSGDVTVSDSGFNSVEIEAVSGDVKYIGSFLEFQVETVSGNCEITTTTECDEIELETVSGNLKLYLPESTGFSLSMDSVSGSLVTDIATTSTGGRKVYGDGHCLIASESVSGNIYIYHNK